jgi:two-component system sensor histidine kinase RegB
MTDAATSIGATSKHAAFVQGNVRSQTLLVQRWLAVIGQLSAILFVHFILGYQVPLIWCLGAIAISAALNVMVSLTYPSTKRLSESEATTYLAYDLVQLTVLMSLTGGLQNPFALLFLAPVVVSATTLSLRNTIALGALGLFCISFLGFYHAPLPWRPGTEYIAEPIYTAGVWVGLVLGLVFTTIYAWRISIEAKRMAEALAATQAALEREHRLSALGGLAAAAAHELGSPLATIATVAKELKRELLEDDPLSDDVILLGSEVDRCRVILSRLGQNPDEQHDHFGRIPFESLLEDVCSPHRVTDINIDVAIMGDQELTPHIYRSSELVHGLGNLIENATEFARSSVTLTLSWTDREITLLISDDGPGFAPEIIDRLGDPYVTTRPRGAKDSTINANDEDAQEGMGLGFFIAKTLLEWSEAKLEFANSRIGGAIVTVVWPRLALETNNDKQ